MPNNLYGLTNAETTKLNDILDVLNIDQLFSIATAIKVICRSGFGSLRVVVRKGEIRLDLSSNEIPLDPHCPHPKNDVE